MAAKSQDKVFFGVAFFLLLASAGWMALQNSKLSSLRTSSEVTITPSAYVPAGIDAPSVSTKTWPSPVAQSSGPMWVYDVFTPPEIYYLESTKQFSVTLPPPPPPPPPPPESRFGINLVGIKQDSFRLQLVGYTGGPGDYRGMFENALSGDTIIGRAGKTIPDLGLTIKSFDVKRNKIESPDSMVTYDTEATAIVVDDKTGEEISLTNKHRRIKGEPFAILRAEGASATIEHKAGAKFTIGDATYTLLTITAEPPSVEIRKEAPDLKEPETKTLTPFVPVAPVPASPAPTDSAPSAQPAPATPFPFGT
jgi:hypothetical protein